MEPNRQDCAIAPERSPAAVDAAGPTPRDRRMQLRAYNHWASLLGRRRFPTVSDLASGAFCDIAPHSVLLDVSAEADGPAIAYLGDLLAGECGAGQGTLQRLGDAPDGSLLARLTGHYRTVLVNRAPSGFAAEFVGLRKAVVLYRGILLPFSSDDVTIDFVLGVMNWKEQARGEAAQPSGQPAEQGTGAGRRAPSPAALLTDWADGPGTDLGQAPAALSASLSQGDLAASEAAPGNEALLPGETACPDIPVALAERLRALPLQPFARLPATGPEFALAVIRRPQGGAAALLGEVPHDAALIELALRRLAR